MTEHQSPQFCANCFTGTLRGDATPMGTEETLYGRPTYITRPEDGKSPIGVVVIIPDAIGWELLNTRALADVYARRIPAVVLVPEFMNGHSFPQDLMVVDEKLRTEVSWLSIFKLKVRYYLGLVRFAIPLYLVLRPPVVTTRIVDYLKALRADPPVPFAPLSFKLGVAGFCWGGKYAIMLAHDLPEHRVAPAEGAEPSRLIDASFTGHPALLTLPADVQKAEIPLSVAGGTADEMLPRAQLEDMKRILEGKDGGRTHHVEVYEDATHGFCVRGDANDPKQGEMGLRAEEQAVTWFQRHFAS